MAGRGPQTFKKRQKEQLRKEKQEEKRAKRLQRKLEGPRDPSDMDGELGEGMDLDLLADDDTEDTDETSVTEKEPSQVS